MQEKSVPVEEFDRCGLLKVNRIDPNIRRFYEDLQEDYRSFFPILFGWWAQGYTVGNKGDGFRCVEPEEATTSRNERLQKENIDLIDKFIDRFVNGGQKENSSVYGLFYSRKKTLLAKYGEGAKTFLKETLFNDDKLNEAVKREPFSCFSADEWRELRPNIKTNLSLPAGKQDAALKLFWREAGVASGSREFSVKIREKGLIPSCKRPDDRTYCCVLTESLRSLMKGLGGKYKRHIKDWNDLKAKVDKYEKNPLFTVINAYAETLSEIDNGLSEYVLLTAVKYINANKDSETNIKVCIDVLRRPEFKSILEADEKSLRTVYSQWKRAKAFYGRKKYPLKPDLKRDIKVRISFGGFYGKYRLHEEGRRIDINVESFGNIICYPSNYFSGLKWDASDVGYRLDFCHRVKRKSGKSYDTPEFSRNITGVMKDIYIQKKDEDFYITFPYKIKHDNANLYVRDYLRTASPDADLLKKFPDRIKFLSADLNIVQPVTVAIAEVGRGLEGPLSIDGYGKGGFCGQPYHFLKDGPRCRRLSYLKKKIVAIKNAIREYKNYVNNDTPITTKIVEWMGAIYRRKTSEKVKSAMKRKRDLGSLRQYYRLCIQTAIQVVNRSFRRYRKEMRTEGYANISEMIRLLEVGDTYFSMISSYERIHLPPKGKLDAKADPGDKRANFRLFVMRRIAAAIQNLCYKEGIGIVILEDLRNRFSSDDENNSLKRLFAPNMLIHCIKQALEKIGVALLLVPPDGTSKTDPITGALGSRGVKYWNKMRKKMWTTHKERLYVERDGEIVCIDSDLAAPINILLRGIGNSVCPYKFYCGKDEESESQDVPKRLSAFFRNYYGVDKVYFYLGESGVEVSTIKRDKQKPLKNCYLYYRQGKIITESEHRQQEDHLREKAMSAKYVPVDVFSERDGFLNFRRKPPASEEVVNRVWTTVYP